MKNKAVIFITAALMLTGCAENTGEPITSFADNSTVSETETFTETSPAVHDRDPEGEGRGAEGVPYFFAAFPEEVTFSPSYESVKYEGRHIGHNDVCWLSYTCSAANFVMTGDRIEATLVSNGAAYSNRQQGSVGVLINGELTKRIRLEDGEQTYTLYEGEELQSAEISIVKLTENQVANTGIKTVTCNAERIAPAPPKELSIEFIGDSITCGYGNEAGDPDKGFDADEENGLLTYGYLTAKNLDADYSMVCISGLGLISNYTEQRGVKEDYLLLDRVYDFADSNFELRRGYDELTKWDFKGGSDIVVINIGTNDYSFTGRDEDLQYEFYEAYYELLTNVRKHNPNAEIVCTMGIMGAELLGRIEAAAEKFSENTGDNKVHVMKFDYQSEEDGYGADFHPSPATHEKAAAQLTEYLLEIRGKKPETGD